MIQSSMSRNKMDSEESKNSPLPSSAGCSSSAPSSAASLETIGDSESHHHPTPYHTIPHPPIVPSPSPHHTITPPPHHSLVPRSCPENWESAFQSRSANEVAHISPPPSTPTQSRSQSPLLLLPHPPTQPHHSPASFVPITQGSEPTVLPERLHSSEHVETLT